MVILIKNTDDVYNDLLRKACAIDVWSIPGIILTGGVKSGKVVAVYDTSVTYH